MLLVGEPISIISINNDQSFDIRGVYDDSYFSNFETGVPVLLETPSFIIKNTDIATFTDEYPLSRNKWRIRRKSNGSEYIIIDYERDDVSTVRYLAELDRNQ